VIGAACLFVPVRVFGRCTYASVLASVSTPVFGGDAACASVTLIVTYLALLFFGVTVVAGLSSAHVHVVGPASVVQDVVHVSHCRVLYFSIGAECLFVQLWLGGVFLYFVVDRQAVLIQHVGTWLSIPDFLSPSTALVTWTCITPLMTF